MILVIIGCVRGEFVTPGSALQHATSSVQLAATWLSIF